MDLRVPFQNYPQAAARPRQAGASAPMLQSPDVPATLEHIFREPSSPPALRGRARIRHLRLSVFNHRSILKLRH